MHISICGFSETNEISKTLRAASNASQPQRKNISRGIRNVSREERNDPKEIAPRRSNFSACKKHCNAVTTLVMVAPLRIVGRDGKR